MGQIDVSSASAVMRGELGIPLSGMDADSIRDLQDILTLETKPWDDQPSEIVRCYRQESGCIWIPRHFRQRLFWQLVGAWNWTEGRAYAFLSQGKLDPERGQPTAVPAMIAHVRENDAGVLVAPTGTGKCLGPGTPVIMADGRVVLVENVEPGDRLMGPDGAARTVFSTVKGRGPMFRVNPIKGEPWVCNDVHVLTLVHSQKGTVVDVPLDEWQKASNNFRHLHKQFSAGIDRFELPPPPPTVDPYFLGVWFGDGSHDHNLRRGVGVTKNEPAILAACESVAETWGLAVRSRDSGGTRCPTHFLVDPGGRSAGRGGGGAGNPLLTEMRRLTGSGKRVPDEIMRGPRNVRLAFLAGFLDTDGSLDCNTFEITQKRSEWARAVWWIARSLGLGATIRPKEVPDYGVYFRVLIYGHVNSIPTRVSRKQAKPRRQKKDATRTGFAVEALGDGDYHGFTLDGDGRFLLGDFTVTHNTCMGLRVAASFGRYIGIPVYAGHMIDHWVEDVGKFLGFAPDEIGIVQGERCDLGKPVTIMMIQSLLARSYPRELYEQIGFLICDEVNRYGAPVWKDTVVQFAARYRLGLSADPRRKDGLDEMVGWLFGSVGHRAKRVRSKDVQAPTVIGCHWNRAYNHASFCKWEKDEHDEWAMLPEAHPSKYDNVLAKDRQRNAAIAQDVYNAAIVGRQILVFSSRVEHLTELRQLVRRLLDPLPAIERLARLQPPPPSIPTTSQLKAGMNGLARERAYRADVQFATFAMARDAYNAPKLDTEVFATPPGDPLQPIGRLREKAEGYDRRPLMVLYWFETTPHSEEKFRKHRERFRIDGMTVQQVERYPPG